MAISQNAGIEHFHARPIENRLAQVLDEGFDITRGEARSGFSFWCAKPKDNIKNRFDLDREILCIYYPYPEVDARVFRYIRQVLAEPDMKDRLDQVLVLLVHQADSEKTAEFVRGHEEWVIVPFSHRGLMSSQRGPMYVRSRLALFAGSHNLFAFASPVKKDAYFFGRDSLVHTLFKRASAEGEASGVFGLRKTGKTSVLYAIRRRACDTNSVFAYVDCQTPGVHALRWWDLLSELCGRFDAELEEQGADNRPRLPRITGERDAARGFGEYIRSLLKRGDCDTLTFMLDEIENLMPGSPNRLSSHWQDDAVQLWQTIRGVSQETEGRLTFILAGVNPASTTEPLLNGQVNPIFQMVTPYYLEPLTLPHIRTMVRAIAKYSGTAVDEDVYSMLHSQYGGHPYLVRLACGTVWESLDTGKADSRPVLTTAALDRQRTEIAMRLEKPVRDILLSLALWYPQEYELLCMLAGGDSDFVLEWARTEKTKLLQFGQFGLIDPTDGRFLIADIQTFLTEKGEEYQAQVQSIASSEVPPEMLPETPDLDLVKALHELQVEIEIRLRRVIVSVLMVAKRFQQRDVIDALCRGMAKDPSHWKNPRSQFVGKQPQDVLNDLHMSDLCNVVLENWKDFSGLFGSDRSRFSQMAQLANIARRVPSHTKVVGKDEAEAFRAASSWMRGHLAKADSMLTGMG